jgi:hypothetical protein
MPKILGWPDTYSTELGDARRREFLERIVNGDVAAAFEGYNYMYIHAGSNEPIDPTEMNKALREAAATVLDHLGGPNEPQIHKQLLKQYDRLFKPGENGGRGPSAGLCWLDFKHLEKSAPPQVVGHSMRERPVRKGNVVCGNIIRMNQRSNGGEGVLIETPEKLNFVQRDCRGGVITNTI